MEKVIVLMSTFNGETYLEEQINSVLNQINVEVEILVRDDGSTDETLKILKDYSDKYNNFKFYKNENIGAAKSFLDLVVKSPKSNYYAFCDQDDVWDSCKLFRAVEKLKNLSKDSPNLYYSNLRVVSSNLNFSRIRDVFSRTSTNKFSALTENLCTGCTAVFNYTAKKMISEHLPDYCTMHDNWLYILCKLLGNTVCDSNAYISYRQHESNTIGVSLKNKPYFFTKKRIMRIFRRDFQPRLMNAINFEKCFKDCLDEYSLQKIHKLTNYKASLKNRLSLFLDNDIIPGYFSGNIRFKLHILWGTV